MANPSVYLVSGASRGLGLGIATVLASKPNSIVFAGARTPSTANALQALTTQHPGTFHIVPLTAGDLEGNKAAIAEIEKVAGKLDVVIANTGIANFLGSALVHTPEVMREHYEVNVIGTLILFQACWPLLSRSEKPKFLPITSGAGSMTDGAPTPVPVLAYGCSKAAENHLAARLYYEHPTLICHSIEPGAIDTDLMRTAEQFDPRIKAFPKMTPEGAAADVVKQVDALEREEKVRFVSAKDGSTRGW